jgi:hypothetical protein
MNLKESFKTMALVALTGAFAAGLTGNQLPLPPGFSVNDTGGAAASAGKLDVKDSPYYKAPDFYNMKSGGSLTLLEHYKTYQQTTDYTCGPAAALTVVTHFKGAPLDDELKMARIMGTGKPTSFCPGTNTRSMSKYFEQLGWTVHSSMTDSKLTPQDFPGFKKFVLGNLQRKVPIMVENVDWGGHWRVIIGYDDLGDKQDGNDVLIMADPSDTTDHLQDGYGIVPAERFFHMWFDAHLFNKGEQEKQWLTAEPPKTLN